MTLVLLLEHDPDFRDLLREFFSTEGYAVELCLTAGDVALRGQSRLDSIAVVDAWGASQCRLTDTEARSIRALASRVPTVMITARAWATGVAAVDLGLSALMQKPVDLESLLQEVERSMSSTLAFAGLASALRDVGHSACTTIVGE